MLIKYGDSEKDFNNAVYSYSKGNTGDAKSLFNDSLKRNPKNIDSILKLAMIDCDNKEYDQSKMKCEEVLKINDKRVDIYDQYSHICYKNKDYAEALPILDKGLKLDGKKDLLILSSFCCEL